MSLAEIRGVGILINRDPSPNGPTLPLTDVKRVTVLVPQATGGAFTEQLSPGHGRVVSDQLDGVRGRYLPRQLELEAAAGGTGSSRPPPQDQHHPSESLHVIWRSVDVLWNAYCIYLSSPPERAVDNSQGYWYGIFINLLGEGSRYDLIQHLSIIYEQLI